MPSQARAFSRANIHQYRFNNPIILDERRKYHPSVSKIRTPCNACQTLTTILEKGGRVGLNQTVYHNLLIEFYLILWKWKNFCFQISWYVHEYQIEPHILWIWIWKNFCFHISENVHAYLLRRKYTCINEIIMLIKYI